MITYRVNHQNSKVQEAARLALKALTEISLEDLPDTFNHTGDSCFSVRHKISKAAFPINIETYRPWNGRFSKVVGYAKGTTIYQNEYMLARMDVAEIAGNIAHETMHFLGYSHKGNRVTAYNLQTVPYVIGYLVEAKVRAML